MGHTPKGMKERTKKSRPKGPAAGLWGRQLEVVVQRAPRLPVYPNFKVKIQAGYGVEVKIRGCGFCHKVFTNITPGTHRPPTNSPTFSSTTIHCSSKATKLEKKF